MTGLAIPSVFAFGSESESVTKLPSWLDPSTAREGSLLHALYLQLLGAGSGGITVRELFTCFEELAQVLSFGLDWERQFRWHVTTNGYFHVEQEYIHLVRNHQPKPKSSPANIASTSRRYGASSSKTVLSSQQSAPATVWNGFSLDTHEGTQDRAP